MSTSLVAADAAQLSTIAMRARSVCVVFHNHPLGPACAPSQGDVAVEASTSAGPLGIALLVRQGIAYSGTDDEVAAWLRSGVKEFADLNTAVHWMRRHVTATDASPAAGGTATSATDRESRSGPCAVRPAHEVTNVERVETPHAPATDEESIAQSLGREVLGQDRAVAQLASLAGRHTAKRYPRRPATALLVGPTGVGKTLLAEQLAHCLTDTDADGWSYLRIDMNEFSEQHSAARLFGSPPGYIGYDDGKDLSAHLRRHPRTVVLFDEIDKAHPRLWLSLMNLMDTGRIAAQSGEIDARRSILLFTSNQNAGTYARVCRDLTEDSPRRQAALRAAMRDNGFPAEIVARIASIAVFDDLSGEVLTSLVLHTLQRVVAAYGLSVDFVEPEVVTELLAELPNGSRGVRDLEHHVDDRFGDHLATLARSSQINRVQIIADDPPIVAV